MATLFITGTDTGVGKTHVCCALITALRGEGLSIAAYKPVASGCHATPQGLRNDDALALQQASGMTDYTQVNPYALVPAIAPHIAAREAGITLDTNLLDAGHARLARTHDLVVVEGAGGWRTPLNETDGLDDWCSTHQWPVLLVVGLRLGCLNHALLSAEVIARRTRLLGWVANGLPPMMDRYEENLGTLIQRMRVPLLGHLRPHEQIFSPKDAAMLRDQLQR